MAVVLVERDKVHRHVQRRDSFSSRCYNDDDWEAMDLVRVERLEGPFEQTQDTMASGREGRNKSSELTRLLKVVDVPLVAARIWGKTMDLGCEEGRICPWWLACDVARAGRLRTAGVPRTELSKQGKEVALLASFCVAPAAARMMRIEGAPSLKPLVPHCCLLSPTD